MKKVCVYLYDKPPDRPLGHGDEGDDGVCQGEVEHKEVLPI